MFGTMNDIMRGDGGRYPSNEVPRDGINRPTWGREPRQSRTLTAIHKLFGIQNDMYEHALDFKF